MLVIKQILDILKTATPPPQKKPKNIFFVIQTDLNLILAFMYLQIRHKHILNLQVPTEKTKGCWCFCLRKQLQPWKNSCVACKKHTSCMLGWDYKNLNHTHLWLSEYNVITADECIREIEWADQWHRPNPSKHTDWERVRALSQTG